MICLYRLRYDYRESIEVRDLDLVRDGSIFVMSQIAATLANTIDIELPVVNIKIDDLAQRKFYTFFEVKLFIQEELIILKKYNSASLSPSSRKIALTSPHHFTFTHLRTTFFHFCY